MKRWHFATKSGFGERLSEELLFDTVVKRCSNLGFGHGTCISRDVS